MMVHKVSRAGLVLGVVGVSLDEYLRRTPERNRWRASQARAEAESEVVWHELTDARRTLEKAELALRHADAYFGAKDAMNAAGHLSERVLPSPLASEVAGVLRSIDLFRAAHPE